MLSHLRGIPWGFYKNVRDVSKGFQGGFIIPLIFLNRDLRWVSKGFDGDFMGI